MSTQIQFKAGQYQKFIATRPFSLGDSGIKIPAQAEIEYDGVRGIYEGQGPANMPQLRGAIKLGWIVPAGEYDPDDLEAGRPQPAGMTIRNAQGGNPMDPQSRTPITTVAAEEQAVGNIQQHARATRELNSRRPGQRVAGSVTVESQTGIEVRRLVTPAISNTNLDHMGEAISQANSVKIQAGVGRTREELAAELPDDEREAYLADVDARRTGYIAEEHPEAARERAANVKKLANRQVVNRVAAPKTQQKEGFNVTTVVGGGVEIADPGGEGGENEVTFEEFEGMRFTNTNVAKPKAAVIEAAGGGTDSRRKIAKAICPDFPDNYVFEDPTRKKIARIQADYEDRPDVIRAVAAAETDEEVRRRLVEEFPGAFA